MSFDVPLAAPFAEELELAHDDVLRRSDAESGSAEPQIAAPRHRPSVERVVADEIDIRVEIQRRQRGHFNVNKVKRSFTVEQERVAHGRLDRGVGPVRVAGS